MHWGWRNSTAGRAFAFMHPTWVQSTAPQLVLWVLPGVIHECKARSNHLVSICRCATPQKYTDSFFYIHPKEVKIYWNEYKFLTIRSKVNYCLSSLLYEISWVTLKIIPSIFHSFIFVILKRTNWSSGFLNLFHRFQQYLECMCQISKEVETTKVNSKSYGVNYKSNGLSRTIE